MATQKRKYDRNETYQADSEGNPYVLTTDDLDLLLKSLSCYKQYCEEAVKNLAMSEIQSKAETERAEELAHFFIAMLGNDSVS